MVAITKLADTHTGMHRKKTHCESIRWFCPGDCLDETITRLEIKNFQGIGQREIRYPLPAFGIVQKPSSLVKLSACPSIDPRIDSLRNRTFSRLRIFARKGWENRSGDRFDSMRLTLARIEALRLVISSAPFVGPAQGASGIHRISIQGDVSPEAARILRISEIVFV